MKPARHEKIVELLGRKGMVSTVELCSILNVSEATVRRDLAELGRLGRIEKTHGGAMAARKTSTDDMPMSLRRRSQREEKIRIAAAALELIAEGESVFLDSGTTTFELAVKLAVFKQLTVVTNDIHIACEMSRSGGNSLIVAGGIRKRSSGALIGLFTEQMLGQLHVDKAFLSVDAVSEQSGFMDYNTDEISLKRLMIQNSRRHIVLCDHTKFGNAAFMSICPLEAVDLTITGRELDPGAAQRLEQAGMRMKLV